MNDTNENSLAVVEMSPMLMIQQAVDKGADPAVIERFMDLQERFEKNEAAKAFTDAVSAFQDECPRIPKTRTVDLGRGGYNYASYDDIMRHIQPLLSRHGIMVSFSMEMVEGSAKMTCTVSKGIHFQTSTFTCPVPKEMRVNESQKMGSARSYAKRYALEDALNIVTTDDDDDGSSVVSTITEEQAIKLTEICSNLDAETVQRACKYYGVESWYDLPADRFETAKKQLLAKSSKKGG